MVANQTTQIPIFQRGDILTAEQLNAIVRLITGRLLGVGGITVQTVGDLISIGHIVNTKANTLFQQMRIKSDQGDYLVCRSLDAGGNEGAADINVLKPFLLRRTPFDGKTVNGVSYVYQSNGERLADGTETQLITQDYYVDAEIFVMRINVNFEVSPNVFTSLADANDNGREWSEPA